MCVGGEGSGALFAAFLSLFFSADSRWGLPRESHGSSAFLEVFQSLLLSLSLVPTMSPRPSHVALSSPLPQYLPKRKSSLSFSPSRLSQRSPFTTQRLSPSATSAFCFFPLLSSATLSSFLPTAFSLLSVSARSSFAAPVSFLRVKKMSTSTSVISSSFSSAACPFSSQPSKSPDASCSASSCSPPFFCRSLLCERVAKTPAQQDNAQRRPSDPSSAPCIRLVVTDLDGTLLNSAHHISRENVEACGRLSDCHVLCAFATGRPHKGTVACIGEETLREMKVPGGYPGIYMNGCTVYGTRGELLHAETLDAHIQSTLFEFFDSHQLWDRICGYTQDGLFSVADNRYTRHTHDTYHEPQPTVVPEEEFRRTLFSKITLNGDDYHKETCPMKNEKQENIRTDLPGDANDLSKWRELLDKLLADKQLPARCVQPIPGNIEVIPRDISKAKGIDVLIKHLGIKKDQVLALGDSENDLEMLKDVEWSICVGNACRSAKECAKFCTLTNDENGFAHVVHVVCDEQGKLNLGSSPTSPASPPSSRSA